LVGDASPQALAGKNAEFAFGDVEPGTVFWGGMSFEPFGDATGFSGRESLVQGCWAMGVQIVLNQNDFFGVGEMRVCQIAQDMGIVDRGTPRANGNMAPSFQGGK
jgi:hypothetical protein